MFEKLVLGSALLFAPMVDNVATEPPVQETTTNEDWENAKDTVIEWTEDLDNNGVPDKIEQTIDQWKNTELVGGVTIGALVSVIIAFLGTGALFMRFRKKIKTALDTSEKAVDSANKQTEKYLKQANEMLRELKEENAKLRREMEQITISINKTNEVSAGISENIKQNSVYLSNIDVSNKKVSVLLDNQVKMACNTDELVSKGIAKDLKAKVTELEATINEEDDKGTKENI